ncbi:uncharacterized protein LOC114662251 [Erpetoichthys calabaricus]|uniref:uncharacterized protein LOC114662251 n=1 Tax=Erpetoichthys calabaricus TaxID=27687 RepID=UPI002234DF8C|nr:uncharacterized protein LOC114662251 [Erpetoichthys calabaricus]
MKVFGGWWRLSQRMIPFFPVLLLFFYLSMSKVVMSDQHKAQDHNVTDVLLVTSTLGVGDVSSHLDGKDFTSVPDGGDHRSEIPGTGISESTSSQPPTSAPDDKGLTTTQVDTTARGVSSLSIDTGVPQGSLPTSKWPDSSGVPNGGDLITTQPSTGDSTIATAIGASHGDPVTSYQFVTSIFGVSAGSDISKVTGGYDLTSNQQVFGDLHGKDVTTFQDGLGLSSSQPITFDPNGGDLTSNQLVTTVPDGGDLISSQPDPTVWSGPDLTTVQDGSNISIVPAGGDLISSQPTETGVTDGINLTTDTSALYGDEFITAQPVTTVQYDTELTRTQSDTSVWAGPDLTSPSEPSNQPGTSVWNRFQQTIDHMTNAMEDTTRWSLSTRRPSIPPTNDSCGRGLDGMDLHRGLRRPCLIILAILGLVICIFMSTTVFLGTKLLMRRAPRPIRKPVQNGTLERPPSRSKRSTEENEDTFWMQPRVTMEEITEFWYANSVQLRDMQGNS